MLYLMVLHYLIWALLQELLLVDPLRRSTQQQELHTNNRHCVNLYKQFVEFTKAQLGLVLMLGNGVYRLLRQLPSVQQIAFLVHKYNWFYRTISDSRFTSNTSNSTEVNSSSRLAKKRISVRMETCSNACTLKRILHMQCIVHNTFYW